MHTYLRVLVDVAHAFQVGHAGDGGHGHVGVGHGGVLLVADDVQAVGLVVAHADEDRPRAVRSLHHLLRVSSGK